MKENLLIGNKKVYKEKENKKDVIGREATKVDQETRSRTHEHNRRTMGPGRNNEKDNGEKLGKERKGHNDERDK